METLQSFSLAVKESKLYENLTVHMQPTGILLNYSIENIQNDVCQKKKNGPIRLTSARLAHARPNYLILAGVLPLVHTVIHYMDNIAMTVLFLSIQPE